MNLAYASQPNYADILIGNASPLYPPSNVDFTVWFEWAWHDVNEYDDPNELDPHAPGGGYQWRLRFDELCEQVKAAQSNAVGICFAPDPDNPRRNETFAIGLCQLVNAKLLRAA